MDDIEQYARQAKNMRGQAVIAAWLCLTSLMVVVLVLIIDNQIKRRLMADVAEARRIVDTFTVNAQGWYANGTQAAEPAGADPEPGSNSADDVGSDPPAGSLVAETESGIALPPRTGGAGNAGGPRGHG